MKFHHLGIVVNSIEKDTGILQKLGYRANSPIILDLIQHNRVVFLVNQEIMIELIEPIDEHSTVINAKPGYHHICYEAEPNEDIIKKFTSTRIGKIFTSQIVAPAINNRKIVFACLQNGTLIELVLGE